MAGLILAFGLRPETAVWAQKGAPVVRGYLFYSETCPECYEVRSRIMPGFYRALGQRLQILAVEVNQDVANYDWFLGCASKYGLPRERMAVPVLFVGEEYLVGPEEIESRLPVLFQGYLSEGGVDYPEVPRPGGPLPATVRFMFFYSPTCPHCRRVEEEVFPAIRDKYGKQVSWNAYDVSTEDNLRALLALGQAAGLSQDSLGAVPMVFIGDEFSLYSMMLGDGEIQTYLAPAIDWFLGVGGVGLPEWSAQLLSPTVTPVPAGGTPSPSAQAGLLVHVAYFAQTGCGECDLVSLELNQLRNRFPNLVVHEFDIVNDLELNICLCEALGVPEEKRHDAPAVFIGTDYLVGNDIRYDRLVDLAAKYVQKGAGPLWKTCEGRQLDLPAPPPWWAVILPGLTDGINPCAFATIVFYVSYLSLMGRKGREVLVVGLAFTLAVFLSYLGFGLVLRELLSGLVKLVGPVLRPVLNALMAAACLVLAVLSFSDLRKVRKGKAKQMALRLPDRLRRWINATIREGMKSEVVAAASFVSGVVVSFIELACTGQVYVPIIQGLTNPAYRARSTLDLVVYCIAFVVPLTIVFLVSFWGTSSQQLATLLRRYTGPAKLATALLFLGISLWLAYDALRISGLVLPLMV